MNNNYIAALIDEIIEVGKSGGVDLSDVDVTAIAIYTLHNIVTATTDIEVDAVKSNISNIIGNETDVSNYLFASLGGISAAIDETGNDGGV